MAKAGPSPLFMAFWQVYPRKVARAEAWKAWKQVGAEAKANVIADALRAQVSADFQHREQDKIPHAATWLRGSRWEDELRAGHGYGKKTEAIIGAARDWTPRKAAR